MKYLPNVFLRDTLDVPPDRANLLVFTEMSLNFLCTYSAGKMHDFSERGSSILPPKVANPKLHFQYTACKRSSFQRKYNVIANHSVKVTASTICSINMQYMCSKFTETAFLTLYYKGIIS